MLSINEIQVEGAAASDEFVEIYNPGTQCDFMGWKLVYRSATGTSDVVLFDAPTSVSVPTYLVLGGAGFSNMTNKLKNGLAKTGGQLALKAPDGTVMSKIGYGTAAGAYVSGTAAPAPGTSKSIARKPDGTDTGDNSADFKVLDTPTPGAAN
jgi:hypothetical protein